jgi:hypothetical protein
LPRDRGFDLQCDELNDESQNRAISAEHRAHTAPAILATGGHGRPTCYA